MVLEKSNMAAACLLIAISILPKLIAQGLVHQSSIFYRCQVNPRASSFLFFCIEAVPLILVTSLAAVKDLPTVVMLS